MTNHSSSIMDSTDKDVVNDLQVEERITRHDASFPAIHEDVEQVMAIVPHSPSMELRNYCSFDDTDIFPYMDGLIEAEVDEALAMATENNGEVNTEDPHAGESSSQMTPLVVPMPDPIRVRNPNAHSLILGSGNEQGRSYSKKQARKKTSTGEEGCRCCTCKKTRCLKLYCSCFAAEEYCTRECVCEGCRNRREFDDEIRDAKQKIVKQDEHAFHSKFELDPDRNKENSDGNHNSLELGKHKKGCNCKKSRCNKNYCECFQAGVACSENCRCNGCNNDHGKREGPADYNDNRNEQLQMITIAERSKSNEVNSNVINNNGGCGNVMMESTYMNNNGAQYMPDFSPFTPYGMPGRVRDFFPAPSSTTMPMSWQSFAMYSPSFMSLPRLPPRHFKEMNVGSYNNMFGYRIGSSSTSPVIGDKQVPSTCSMNLYNNGRFGGGSVLGNQNQSMLLNNGCIYLPDYDGLVAKQHLLQSTYKMMAIPPLPDFDRGKRMFGEQEHPLQLPFGTNSQLLIGYQNKNNSHNNLDSGDCTSEYEQMLRTRTTDGMMHPVPTKEYEMRNVNEADVADADGTMRTHFPKSDF